MHSIVAGQFQRSRIFSFPRFVDVLRLNSVGFVQPGHWDDPYENPLEGKTVEDGEGKRFILSSYSNTYYAQCWWHGPESDAMWRIYSPNRQGVLVSCQAASLHQSLSSSLQHPTQQLYIGRVQYLTALELQRQLQDPQFIQSLVHSRMYYPDGLPVLLKKRDSFMHENEIRVIMSDHISRDPVLAALSSTAILANCFLT